MTKNMTWVRCEWFREEEDEEEEDEGEYSDSYEEGRQQMPKMVGFGPSIIVTPFGPVNEDDIMNPVFDTEFFLGHTNFNLSKDILEGITKVDGVEFLKIMSRYRFIVGIGVMFDAKEVLDRVEKSIGIETELAEVSKIKSSELSTEASNSLQCIVNEISDLVPMDKKWLAYIFPNGEHIVKVLKDDKEYTTAWEGFSKLAKESNGVIVGSEDR